MYLHIRTLIFHIFRIFEDMDKKPDKALLQFGKNLKALRLSKGFSIRGFAMEVDIAPSFLDRMENGLSSPTLTTLLKLAKALDVDLNTLGGYK